MPAANPRSVIATIRPVTFPANEYPLIHADARPVAETPSIGYRGLIWTARDVHAELQHEKRAPSPGSEGAVKKPISATAAIPRPPSKSVAAAAARRDGSDANPAASCTIAATSAPPVASHA